MIHSGRYDESIEDFGFIPLNAFYECPDGVPPFLPLSRDGFLRMQDLFDAFGAALASRNDPRWSCWTRLHLLMILESVSYTHLDVYKRQAHRCIEKEAMDTRLPKREVARDILRTFEG